MEWRCAGCGVLAPERVAPCDCPTHCVYDRKTQRSEWKVWPVLVNGGDLMSKTAPTQEQIDALADAMCMVLNDMGNDGLSICVYVKAKARIAFAPFQLEDDGDLPSLDWATDVVNEVDSLHGKRA